MWAIVANAGRLVGVDESAEAREMDFEELLDRSCDSASLPEMARLLLPSTLGAETKNLVLKLTPEEFGRILASAIDQINHGSVKPIDTLVNETGEKMIILWIILWIFIIAAFVGLIALVMELFAKSNSHRPYGPYERFIKRFLDAFLSTGALIVFSPILLITAILVRIKLGSPVLFTQDRPGRDEKIFKLYKFRSMTNQRDENGKLLPDDVRLTKFGRILRSTSLDELPELLNIIKGDMAVIGPRPLLVEYLPYYTVEEHHRHDIRPGLTGWAQVNGRNAIGSWEERFKYDLEYVNHVTFAMDLKVLLTTVKKVVRRSDIQVGSEIKVGRLDVARSGNNNKKI